MIFLNLQWFPADARVTQIQLNNMHKKSKEMWHFSLHHVYLKGRISMVNQYILLPLDIVYDMQSCQ